MLSFRRIVEAERGSCGEGSEMWWNAGMGFLGVRAIGRDAGSSGRPPAVGDG
jgi:hypothetical protein